MAKLTLLLATFALFLLFANATLHATVEIDAENPQRQGQGQGQGKSPMKCHQEFQAHRQLRACQRYIRKRTTPRFEDIFLDEDVEDEMDDLAYENPQRLLQSCCRQLRQIDPPCRCPSLRMAARQELQKGQGQGPSEDGQGQQGQGPWQGVPLRVKKVLRVATNIPSLCQLPPQRCSFGHFGPRMELDLEE